MRTVIVVGLGAIVLFFLSDLKQQNAINDLRENDTALVACIENTAYSRELISQCLQDYRMSED